MAEPSTVEQILEHYGIKGMRWGVRRTNTGNGHGPKDLPNTKDSTRAKALSEVARKGGTSKLTNQELQELVTRMNLEQQYSRVTPPSGKEKAVKFVAGTLASVGKQQVTRLANDAASKQVDAYMAAALKKKK